MSKSPIAIGLGAAIFLIQALLVGVSFPTMLAAALICGLFLFLLAISRYTVPPYTSKAIQSLERVLLPKLSHQVENSSELAHQAITELGTKVENLRQNYHSLKHTSDLSDKEREKYLRQVEQTFKEILVLLQFGDRLRQQQQGVIEGLEEFQLALSDLEHKGWDEEALLGALERIEQKTRLEGNKSPQDEGSVTFF
ncbi:hypothetical protein F0231_12100 [Vibrio sp. RE86]|uniref:hypothetical protein n=1 Tax=Vibrio sp. RE86 TaxID=2607605 RepID=UPI0014939887|nr:hypothetical protein [Vibrio sp. RE86]NOH80482.1 hypothetical protein [Vibrio sp. RE86]